MVKLWKKELAGVEARVEREFKRRAAAAEGQPGRA